MKKNSSIGTTLFLLAIVIAVGLYRARHPSPTASTAPGHVIAYSPGADSATVQNDKTKTESVVYSTIDPATNKGENKIDPDIKVGDKGTIFYESPSGRVEFRPDPK